MEFRNLRFEDIPTIQSIVYPTGYQTCQLAVSSLYCYADKYQTQICVEDGFLFIKQSRPDYPTAYFMPIGTGNLSTAVNRLIDYHKSNSEEDMVIWGITDDMLGAFKKTAGYYGECSMCSDRDWAEYIHSAESLLDMRGKRFHAKKNAVNQFLRNNPDYSYEPITPANIAEVAAFQKALLADIQQSDADPEQIESLTQEDVSIQKGLKHFEVLGLIGGLIRIDGNICAYAFGGAINPKVFDMTFEKALKNYNGIFQVLEQEMIRNELSSFEYINREEDLGIPGLRFAKEKLRPDTLLMKHTTIVKKCYQKFA